MIDNLRLPKLLLTLCYIFPFVHFINFLSSRVASLLRLYIVTWLLSYINHNIVHFPLCTLISMSSNSGDRTRSPLGPSPCQPCRRNSYSSIIDLKVFLLNHKEKIVLGNKQGVKPVWLSGQIDNWLIGPKIHTQLFFYWKYHVATKINGGIKEGIFNLWLHNEVLIVASTDSLVFPSDRD